MELKKRVRKSCMLIYAGNENIFFIGMYDRGFHVTCKDFISLPCSCTDEELGTEFLRMKNKIPYFKADDEERNVYKKISGIKSYRIFMKEYKIILVSWPESNQFCLTYDETSFEDARRGKVNPVKRYLPMEIGASEIGHSIFEMLNEMR